MKNGQLQHLNPWQKVVLCIALILFASSFAQLINLSLAKFLLNTNSPRDIVLDLTRIDGIRMMKIGNFIFHLIAFIAPVLLLTKLFNSDPKEAILFRKPAAKHWLWVPIAFVLLTFINQGLYMINHQIDFSFISASVQESFEYQQAVQEKTIYAYIGETWRSYFANVFLIALIPAISEELLFRGLIQNLFTKATQNIWVGITISSILFALIHLQPFNFLPMLALGFCYGMIVAFTGSLWISMVLHLLNNAFILTVEHFQRMFNWDELTISLYAGLGIVITLLVLLIVVIRSDKIPSKWYQTKGIYLR